MVKEKIFDKLIDKYKDIEDKASLKEALEHYMELALEIYEKSSYEEDFDFQGLIECVYENIVNNIDFNVFNPDPNISNKTSNYLKEIACDKAHANTRKKREIVSKYIDDCLDIIKNHYASKIAPKELLMMKMSIEPLLDAFKQLNEAIPDLLKISSSNTRSQLDLKNDNDYFIGKYNGSIDREKNRLFLDKKPGDKYIFLKDVYVSPSISSNGISLEDKLYEWAFGKDDNNMVSAAPIYILYGKAGVGKSSLIAHLLEKKFFGELANALVLRNYKDRISSENPWTDILSILECDEKNLSGKVIILDGLDELCLLNSSVSFEKEENIITGFNGNDFIKNLVNEVPDNIKILITSREPNGYFKQIDPSNEIMIDYLKWEKEEAISWCKKYSDQRKNAEIDQWVERFISSYDSLSDEIKSIVNVPIIIYIACHERISVDESQNRSEIYYKAFNIIAHGDYNNPKGTKELNKKRDDDFIILWQLAKEIAYQMFLNDLLGCEIGNELINNAIKSTKTILNLSDNSDITGYLHKIPTVFYFAQGSDHGIEYAHKSVGEYFTALKIFEDYFIPIGNGEDYSKVWENTFQAFRFKVIPNDIFEYLNDMVNKSIHLDKFNFDGYQSIVIDGIKNEQLYIEAVKKPEYSLPMKYSKNQNSNMYYIEKNNHSVDKQLKIAFRNLSCFLTSHGFDSSSCNYLFIYFKPFLSAYGINMENWKLNYACEKPFDSNENVMIIKTDCGKIMIPVWNKVSLSSVIFNKAHLEYSYFRGAYLENAQMEDTHLEHSYMSRAHLQGANLKNAHLEMADLSYARLEGTVFYGANLEGASLKNARLEGADFRGANIIEADFYNDYYNEKTMFDNDNIINEFKMIKCEIKTPIPPHSRIEKEICNIISNFMGGGKIYLNDNLFDLGFDSIKIMGLSTIIYTTYNINLPVNTLFEHATPEGLVRSILLYLPDNYNSKE